MKKFDQSILQDMKKKLDVELMGVASLNTSTSSKLREKAAVLLPGVKSVIVLGKEIYKEVVSLLSPVKEVGEAIGGDLLASHADFLNGRLNRAVHELARFFRDQGYSSLPLMAITPTDQRFLTPLFSYKYAAQLAGLGTIGRHSLLITPEFGPRERLACLLTQAELETLSLSSQSHCTGCNSCIKACPSHALQIPATGETYSINKFACRTYRQAGITCSMCMKACDEVTG